MRSEKETKTETTALKPDKKLIIALFALMPIIAGGLGFEFGYWSLGDIFSDPAPENAALAQSRKDSSNGHGETQDTAKDNEETAFGNDEDASHSENGQGKSVTLEPVLTNISTPSDVWIRFESVLELSEPLPKEITNQIHQDFLAYFHSLHLSELTGASAFMDLKTELLARANVRAEGKVETVYIKTFLFE